MKILKKILLILLLVLVIAQFFRPDKNDGNLESVNAFVAETKPSNEVKAILVESCFDCHSDHTRYPWYNNITPINYWLADHVAHGRKHLNVSKWEAYSVERKDHKFEEIIEMINVKEMPLKSYTYTHSEANLSDTQIKQITDWANQVRIDYALIKPIPQ